MTGAAGPDSPHGPDSPPGSPARPDASPRTRARDRAEPGVGSGSGASPGSGGGAGAGAGSGAGSGSGSGAGSRTGSGASGSGGRRSSSGAGAGPGRRPGRTETREQILAAARRLFAEKGYDATSLRAVARAAEVDPALIHHFFDNKAGLLVASLRLPVNPRTVLSSVLLGPPERRGETLARIFLSVWADEESRTPLLGLMRSSITSEHAATMMREFASSAVLTEVSARSGVPPLRVAGAMGQLFGLMYFRYVIKVEPLASASEDDLVAMVAPVLQYYLGDQEPGGGEGAPAPVVPPAVWRNGGAR